MISGKLYFYYPQANVYGLGDWENGRENVLEGERKNKYV